MRMGAMGMDFAKVYFAGFAGSVLLSERDEVPAFALWRSLRSHRPLRSQRILRSPSSLRPLQNRSTVMSFSCLRQARVTFH